MKLFYLFNLFQTRNLVALQILARPVGHLCLSSLSLSKEKKFNIISLPASMASSKNVRKLVVDASNDDDYVVQFSEITKEWSSDSISLKKKLVDWICGNVILTWTQNILQFGWGMDQKLLKRNCNESLAMSLLEILCSSCSSRSSCVLRLRRFMVEVLRCFKGLNLWSFTDLWFVNVFWTFELDSRKL